MAVNINDYIGWSGDLIAEVDSDVLSVYDGTSLPPKLLNKTTLPFKLDDGKVVAIDDLLFIFLGELIVYSISTLQYLGQINQPLSPHFIGSNISSNQDNLYLSNYNYQTNCVDIEIYDPLTLQKIGTFIEGIPNLYSFKIEGSMVYVSLKNVNRYHIEFIDIYDLDTRQLIKRLKLGNSFFESPFIVA
jgi:hypothetical protein